MCQEACLPVSLFGGLSCEPTRATKLNNSDEIVEGHIRKMARVVKYINACIC